VLTDRTVERPGVTRRTVLAASTGAVAVGALAAAVGVQVARPRLPLDGTVLEALVGHAFVDTQTGARLVLSAVDGVTGRAATAERFALVLTADAPLPAATRTLRHPDGDLLVYLGPVGPDPRTLEAVVDRTGDRA
jgi:hypothetical protein